MSTSMANNSIGFFDSGVGGLTVYSKFRKLMPQENCLYLGDTVHMPYGNKTREELISYARAIMDFYQKKEVKAVVIACNTSSSVAYDVIKDDYDFEIYPIIQNSCEVIGQLPIKSLGLLATKATVESGVYEREIKKYNKNIEIYSHSCINWAKIVEGKEQYTQAGEDEIVADLKNVLKYEPEKIILGCTHYPYLMDILSKYTAPEKFIDPAEYFVNYIKTDLEEKGLIREAVTNGEESVFVTANIASFVTASKMFYNLESVPSLVNLG